MMTVWNISRQQTCLLFNALNVTAMRLEVSIQKVPLAAATSPYLLGCLWQTQS